MSQARWRRRATRLGLVLLALGVASALASVAVEGPLKRELERRVNAELEGYTATIGRLDLHPLRFSFDLEDVTVVQNALPRPPTIYIPRWRTSVQWRALLSGAVVADVVFTRPEMFITFIQADHEARDAKPAAERGWQDAVTTVSPLEVNEFRIDDGTITYFDTGTPKPVRLDDLYVRARNIRNVRSLPSRHPSPIQARATLDDGARLTLDGRADFLATPHATVKGTFGVRGLGLERLQPALRHAGFETLRGTLDVQGHADYARTSTTVAIDRLTLSRATVEYVQRGPEEEQALDRATRAATTPKAAPDLRVDIAEAVVSDSTFALVDTTSNPPYRLFVTGTDARLRGFSNQKSARRGALALEGRFMDSGPMLLQAGFASGAGRPDFELELRMEEVALQSLNDLLRAKGGFDVTDGRLSVYSALDVRGGRIRGYVKPLFSDMDVYDSEQDRDKNLFQQLYEAIIGGTAKVLENRPRDEVATITDLSGPVEDPESSTFEVVIGLLQNAFVKAILPGLEERRRS